MGKFVLDSYPVMTEQCTNSSHQEETKNNICVQSTIHFITLPRLSSSLAQEVLLLSSSGEELCDKEDWSLMTWEVYTAYNT